MDGKRENIHIRGGRKGEESTMKHDTETSAYAHMGMAALLPGMQHMLTLMQAQLDEMRARLPIHSRW